MNILGLFIVLYLKVWLISCQFECKNLYTCGECIRFGYDTCVWCSAENHSGPRCESKGIIPELSNTTVPWCQKDIYDPKLNEIVKETKDDFNDGKNKSKIIQFKPQFMKLKTRTNAPIDIKISYKPAKDYPLDIYYLMDYSETMRKYARTLRKQGSEIFRRLTEITNNVRMGIGSFVDKPALPFAYPNEGTYSFRHHLRLTDNVTLFNKALKTEPSGYSNDKPEADFDALMQAMVCKDEVGWRDKANRIIFLSTDSTYHSAGDGKFVGAIKPNDMQCHLIDNKYSEALVFDYPSVSQINKVATDNNIRIIFAVSSEVKRDYDILTRKIQNSKSVYLKESAEVVDLIIKEYHELVDSVQLDANVPSFASLTFKPDCTVKGACLYKNKESVETVATLTVKSCPTDDRFSLKIGPVSLSEKLLIEVEVNCQCDCEKDDKGEKKSDKCSHAGTYQCGICKCDEKRYGDICNCTGNSTLTEDFNKCKANKNEAKFCSGRGTCSCGKCIACAKGFSGQFCEFDDNSCPRRGGVQCSGRGKCVKGRCECDAHWLPNDCYCPDNDQSCIGPNSDKPCSGRGECKCGECTCNRAAAANESCSGRYCDECEESQGKRCKELEDYALCNTEANMTRVDCERKYNLTHTEVIIVNRSEIHSSTWYMASMWCSKVLEDGRTFVFKYRSPTSTMRKLLIIIQNELDMPPIADVWIVVASTIGSVLLIGIITIVAWKVLVDLHDKREYENFKKASEAAGYDVSNPLYHNPATSIQNPTYTG